MSRSRSVVAMAAVSSAVALFGAGCGGDDEGSGTGESAGEARGENITIGMSQRGIAGSDWWKTLVQGVKDEAKRQGAKVDVTDAGGDTVRQLSDVRTLLSRQVKGLIINPNDPRGVSPAAR